MLNASQAIMTLSKARETLPRGHYGLRDARKAVDSIYAACHEQEKEFIKKLPKRYKKYRRLSLEDAKQISNFICDFLSMTPIKKIVVGSREVMSGASAHYSRKEIHFAWRDRVPLSTLIHELTHHVQSVEGVRGDHGKDFCMFEMMLFEVCGECLQEMLNAELKAQEEKHTKDLDRQRRRWSRKQVRNK